MSAALAAESRVASRRTGHLLLMLAVGAALLGAGCSGSAASVEGTAPVAEITTLPPVATTASPPVATTVPPSTTVPIRTVVLQLHPVEALAARGGPGVAVSVDGAVAGTMTADAATLPISVTGPAEITFTYVDAGGAPTEVVWTETVAADVSQLDVVQPWRNPDRERSWHVAAWSRAADREEAVASLNGASPVTVHSPLWWFVGSDGSLSGGPDAEFVELASAAGAQVWPAVQGIDADALHLLVADDDRRTQAVSTISATSLGAGAHGVNIDIEGFRNEDAAAVSAFIEELADAVHAWGGVVSYDVVPRSDSWDIVPEELAYWSTAPERRRIAAAVDFTILMAYDQHNRFRPSGPVAAPSWVEEMLVYQLRYSDPQDIILGLPAYGRIWDAAELDSPRAVSLGFLETLDGVRTPDSQYGVDRIDLDDGRFFWAEHEIQGERADLADQYGLSGVAVWRLGLDSPSLWEAIDAVHEP